jgi:hypothetical protein
MLCAHLDGLVTENKLIKMHRVNSFKILVVVGSTMLITGMFVKIKVLMPFLCEVQHNPIMAVLTRDTNKPESERFDTGSS